MWDTKIASRLTSDLSPSASRRRLFCVKFIQNVQISTKPPELTVGKPVFLFTPDAWDAWPRTGTSRAWHASCLIKQTESETVAFSFLLIRKISPLPVNSASAAGAVKEGTQKENMSPGSRNPRKRKTVPAPDQGEKECVWMRAKVVNFKLCDRDYDCSGCHFDKAMKSAWKQDIGDKETLE